MKAIWLAALLFALGFITPAFAQQAPDPRISGQMMVAMQAEIALRDAAIKAMQEDAAKREAEWAEYSRALWRPATPEGK